VRAKIHVPAWVLGGVLAMAMARPGAAVDGVIEINQARALAGGVTATDDPGFPVTIDKSGSYRLTGDLAAGAQDGIQVTNVNFDVDLDLNGFSITGTDSGGTKKGIAVGVGRLRVHNGTIREFGAGIDLLGITLPLSMTVEAIRVEQNGIGVRSGENTTIVDSVAVANAVYGFALGSHAIVRGCVAAYNSVGVVTDQGALVSGNNVFSNTDTGIWVGDGSTVVGNIVSGNQTGVRAQNGSLVLDNTIRGSGSFGVVFSSGTTGYGRNVLTGNNTGDGQPQFSIGPGAAAIQLGTNICGTASC
jgi:parallel beta-helix repeat protein